MRHNFILTAVHYRSSTVLHVLTAALAAAILTTAFVHAARAQTPDAKCPDGMMRRSDAQTGMLLFKSSTPGCYIPAPRVTTDFNIDISGPIARTKLTQRFENPADGWVEGVYVFPLPETAAVDTLKMKIGERFIEGDIKERQQARAIYEQAKAEGKAASLVEEERPNVFTNNVANIGPHNAIVVQIEYQESLQFDADKFHLRVPLVVAPRYSPKPTVTLANFGDSAFLNVFDPVADRERLDSPVVRPEGGKLNPVSMEIRLEAGFPLGVVESDSHKITVVRNGDTGAAISLSETETPADKDFTLDFAPLAGATPQVSLLKETQGDSDYLLALVVPPAMAVREQPRPREAIFVLDNSGSMAGESIRQAKASLLLALDRLTAKDKFNVIRFDHTLTVLFPAPVDATTANVAYAKGYVSHIEADGGTEMLPALLAALKDATPADETRLRQVIFLTDGEVGNEAQLFSAIGEKLGRTRLFTVGIGSSPNAYFMGGAARAGRGAYTYIGAIDQVAPRMAELFDKLEHPVMTELTARWPDVLAGEAWPNPLPDLYEGEPVVMTLKAAHSDGTLTLTGNLEGQPWSMSLDLSKATMAHGIEKLWARNKISALEESRVNGVDTNQIDNAVLAVALGHHLTSRLTSLVAVDVTPSRPADESLTTGHVALNLPDGWVYDKVFGEESPVVEHQASAVAPSLLMNLAFKPAPTAAVAPDDAGLVLPQGGTESELLLLMGLVAFLLGGLTMLPKGARK